MNPPSPNSSNSLAQRQRLWTLDFLTSKVLLTTEVGLWTRLAAPKLLLSGGGSSLIALILLSALSLPAATVKWDGGPSGTANIWTTPANWLGDALPGTADDAVLDNSLVPLPSTLEIDANTTVGGIQFLNGFNANNTVVIGNGTTSGTALTISSGTVNPLITNNAVNGTVTFAGRVGGGTVNMTMALGGSGSINVVNPGATVVISNIISGAANLTKNGAGKLSLLGANTYSGTMTINGGTVEISADSGLGTAPGTATAGYLTLNGGTIRDINIGTGGTTFINGNRGIAIGANGGTIDISSASGVLIYTSGQITGSGNTLTKIGLGTFRNTTPTSITFTKLVVNAGLYQGAADTVFGAVPGSVLADAITLNGGGIGANAGFTMTANRGITIGANGGEFNCSSTLTVAGIIGGTGAITKTGVNGLLLNAANTYSGGTTLSAGNLQLGNNSALGTGKLTLNTAGTKLSANTTAKTLTIPVDLASDVTLGDPTQNGNLTFNTGPWTIKGATRQLTIDTITTTISGNIGEDAAGRGLTKAGSGTLTLSGVNTYSGKTTISAGLLTINQGSGLDSVLGTAPASPVADQLIFNGGALSLGSAANVTLDVNRGITLQAGGGQIQGASKDLTIPGNIVGVGGFIKTNSANLTLSGANTFAGDFKIYGGGVRFNGDDTAGHGNVLVGPTTANVTLRNLSPTVTSSLTNNITLNSGGTSDIDVTCAAGNTFTLSGNIGGTGYLLRGKASGASGNVVLSGNNTFSGGLFWGRGPLTLGHKNALGTGTLTLTNLVATESNVLMSATALTGANAVGNAVSLTGLMIVAGANDLELSGAMTLAAGNNTITNRNTGAFVISGAIGGGLAGITISGPGTTVFSGASANTHSGGTVVNGSLEVQKDGGLGTGTVTVGDGATLKLDGGVNNTYIASTADLRLNGASPVVNLAFTGTPNTIARLSFDGGATFKAAGTWGAVGSGAQHQDARFTGAGLLNVTTGPTTTTGLTSSSPTAAYGAAVTLTAAVSASAGTAAGTVQFYDGVTLIGSAPTVGGVANLNAAGLLNVAGSPHSLTAVFVANNDFAGSTSSAISQTISAATVTASVTVSGKTYDGTTAGTIVNRSLSGVFGSDDVTLGTSGSATFADKNIGTGKPVTVAGLAITGTTAPNYVLASDTVNTSANINAVALTVTGISAASKAYDGSTVATITGTPVLSGGVVGSEDVTLTGSPVGNFATRSPGTAKSVSVTGLSLTGADIGNYSLSVPALSADITAPPPLTVTGVTANNKPFDGTTNATLVLTNAALAGVVGSDTVTLVTSNAVGAFETPDVADGKTVTVAGLAIAGADATNYSLTQPTTTADIKLALNVTNIVASAKVYDGGTAASVSFAGAGLEGVQGTDDVTLNTTGASAAFADKNVGTGKTVTVAGLALAGADASKYLLVTITASADITAAPLTVSGLSAQNRTYDGGTVATVTGSPALSGLAGGDSVVLVGTAAGSFANKNAGLAKAVTVTSLSITGIDAGNYLFTLPTLSADIAQAGLTVTGLAAQSRVYNGGTVAAVTGTPALSGVIGTDDVSLTGTAAGSFGDKAVGISKPVTVSGLSTTGADAGNYALTQPTVNASITPAGLTVTGLSATSKVYDRGTAASVVGTPALSGVIGTDDVSVSGTAAGSFANATVGTAKPVTVTGLSISGADAGNYALTLPTLSANITPAGLTVTGLAAQNRGYDGGTAATVTGTPALSGVITPDDVSLSGTASGSFGDKAVGTAKPVTVSGLSITGTDAANYALTEPTLNANITAAGLTVTGLSAQSRVYNGGTVASVTGTPALSGVIGTDDVSLTGTAAGSFADKAVGVSKPVTVSGLSTTGADAGNYALTLPTLSADITSAPLTVTGITANNKPYDGTTNATLVLTNATLLGVIGSDAVTLVASNAVGAFETPEAGTGKTVNVSSLEIAGADATNYSLTQPTPNADITPAGLTVIGLSAQSRVYDGGIVATVTGTPVLSGVIGTDDVSLTGTATGNFGDKAVGVAKPVTVSGLSPTGADATNYSLTQPTLSADITPAPLTVTGLAAQNRIYDGGTVATVTGTPALSGIIGTDDVSLTGTAAGSFADKTVGNSKPVTVSGLTTTGADAGNYALTLPTLNANITPASLTVTGLSAQSRVYNGGTVASVTGTPAISGVLGTDGVSLTGTATGSFADKAVGTSKPVTVSGLTTTGADAGNYALTLPTLNANITPAGLTVTGLSAQNKVYDGTTAATLTGTPALSGVIGTDDVSLSGTASGVFADKNVGTGKTVTVSGLSTTGTGALNYALTQPTLNADITALSTTNSLVSSLNPSIMGSNVTFTATLAGNPPAADSPTGDVVFLVNGVPFATNALASGSAAASTTSLPLGTNTVSAEYAGDGNFLGSTGTVQQAVETGVTCSGVNMLTGITNNQNGTLTLSFIGTPQAQYYVLSSADVTAPVSSWTILAGSTNTVTNVSGAWTFTVTNAAPVQFYRSGAVAPCP